MRRVDLCIQKVYLVIPICEMRVGDLAEYFPVLSRGTVCCAVQGRSNVESVDESVTIQMKATEQYFLKCGTVYYVATRLLRLF